MLTSNTQTLAATTIKKTISDSEKLMGIAFNNRLWRETLKQVCQSIDTHHLGLEVISPFGFELLENKRYLSRKLRRFYAYIGAPRHLNINQEEIVSQFKEIFFEKLTRIDINMLNDFVIVIENNDLYKLRHDGYVCKPEDKLFDIQFRFVDTDILTDYANYTMAVLDGLYREKGEGKEFRVNKISRWRLYQLYIIQEQIFGNLLPPMNKDECKNYKAIFEVISNMIQLFYAPSMIKSAPTSQEEEIIGCLIKPRIAEMYKQINSYHGSQKKTIKCQAYHSDDVLELTLDAELYQDIFNRIKQTYLMFI